MARRRLGALGGLVLFAGGVAIGAGPDDRTSIHRQLAELLFRSGDLDGAWLELQAAARGDCDQRTTTRPLPPRPPILAPDDDELAPVRVSGAPVGEAEDELAPVRVARNDDDELAPVRLPRSVGEGEDELAPVHIYRIKPFDDGDDELPPPPL
jgi:hypothetical protein